MSARPTLLILDDIDVSKSVSNIEIIQQNEKKILGETISALDPLRRKIIFLGNTINEDGIVPRFRNNYKDSPNWDIFHQPLVKDNINQRPEVFTQEVIETLQEDGKMSRNMNYLLVASTTGSGAFIKSYFDYFLESHFEDIDTGLKRSDVERGIYVDPAFSTDSRSDDACVVGGGRHKLTKAFYLWD